MYVKIVAVLFYKCILALRLLHKCSAQLPTCPSSDNNNTTKTANKNKSRNRHENATLTTPTSRRVAACAAAAADSWLVFGSQLSSCGGHVGSRGASRVESRLAQFGSHCM